MTVALRKGWCPGALRPMAAKDGLLVRLRITGGILPAATALTLADLAERHGNSHFDLSARCNLQMRGVRDDSLEALQDSLRGLGLLDTDTSAESIRNVLASPLAGLHGGLDIRPLVHALEQRLVHDRSLGALPGKFGFLIDDGGAPSLADIDTDVRFDRIDGSDCFAVCLAGSRRTALYIGSCDAARLVDEAARIAAVTVGLMRRCPEARRMRALVDILGAREVARAFDAKQCAPSPATPRVEAQAVVGSRVFGALKVLGLAAPFGQLESGMLRIAARIAAKTLGELRLTPWRTLLVPGASSDTTPDTGFITDATDPRLQIAACVGADGCERGSTATREDASRLAPYLAGRKSFDIHVHISGCAKGCAKPSPTPFTLVACDGRYDLVKHGRAGGTPTHRDLDLAAAIEIIVASA